MIYFVFFFICSIFSFVFSLLFIIIDLTYFIELELIIINSSLVVITLLLDWISLLFIRFVLFISSIVIYYRDEYISGDLNINRFILLVVIFVVSMILLIIRPNLISILLGWDGLGLISYCLVIYYQNVKSFNAGIITALSNRIGDVALLIRIAWILNYGRWNYLFYLEELKNIREIRYIRILIILAAITKRAQIPFSSWLPAAIAAPTPVSSLVHSSTLVTAGVYLLIRFNFSLRSNIIIFLLFIGSITIFISGLGANFEFDLKKIIALSTLSQLGLIIRILALGSYKLAFFHLLTHALFKALLFMCAGNIIHNLRNCQDIRFIGGLIQSIPLTCIYINVRNLALCGIPFLAGFYSKDLILEVIRISYLNLYIYVVFYLSIGLTVSYRFRLVYYLFVGDLNFYRLRSLSEHGFTILRGIGGLILLVVIIGRILSWLVFGSLYVIILPTILKVISLLMITLGILIGYNMSLFNLSNNNLSLNYIKISYFLAGIWNMPLLSTFGINYNFLVVGNNYIKNLDQGWVEYYGSQNLYKNIIDSSLFIIFIFNNNIKIFFVILIILLLFICLYLNSLFRA